MSQSTDRVDTSLGGRDPLRAKAAMRRRYNFQSREEEASERARGERETSEIGLSLSGEMSGRRAAEKRGTPKGSCKLKGWLRWWSVASCLCSSAALPVCFVAVWLGGQNTDRK